jgi:hypothetical protein
LKVLRLANQPAPRAAVTADWFPRSRAVRREIRLLARIVGGLDRQDKR